MFRTLQGICVAAIAGYTAFVAWQAQRAAKPIRAKAVLVVGLLAALAVFVLPAVIKATLVTLLLVLAVVGLGYGYVRLKLHQRRRRELT